MSNRLFHLLLFFAVATGVGHATEVFSFTSRSFAQLRAENRNAPLVVSFWSVNCEPCKAELSLLTQLHHEFPSVKIVIVAADPPEFRAAVLRFLDHYSLGAIHVGQFGAEPEERLRYSVDPKWRGELPRAYYFHRDGSVSAQSGIPDEAWARSWFERASTSQSTAR